MRAIALSTVAIMVLAAGCAEEILDVPSNAEAAALFADGAGNVPDRYGVRMTATREGTELMAAEGVFDEPAQTAYFSVKMHESLASQSGGMGMSIPSDGVSIYSTPDGSAILMGTSVVVTPPGEDSMWSSQADQNEGLDALTDPEAFLSELGGGNVSVTSVTPTTLRGKPALELDAVATDEDGARNVTIFLFQDPTRVARVEMMAPDDDPQMAGATIAMDILYDDEIDVEVPDGLRRALGLRYESDRGRFGFGASMDDGEGPETWTFQVDGGIALSEVEAQVGMGAPDDEVAPLWTMPLSEGTKTVDDLTLTFDDADGDGEISAGDTLTIARGEDADGLHVVLLDTVSGLRVTPGAGIALVALATLGAAMLARRQ